MPVLVQIALGSGILLLCTLQHIWLLSALIRYLQRSAAAAQGDHHRPRFTKISLIVVVLLASHTVHVYLWALSVLLVGALQGYEEPIYFALVTYTTLGYGDVTLGDPFRIFGAMGAVTGTVAFGLSTAFLVGYFARTVGAPDA